MFYSCVFNFSLQLFHHTFQQKSSTKEKMLLNLIFGMLLHVVTSPTDGQQCVKEQCNECNPAPDELVLLNVLQMIEKHVDNNPVWTTMCTPGDTSKETIEPLPDIIYYRRHMIGSIPFFYILKIYVQLFFLIQMRV